MPIDLDRVVGAEVPGFEFSWDADDVILYHLGIGAGDPPTDPGELEYAYEERLKVLPSFAVIPALPALFAMLEVPGMDVELRQLLHGQQELTVHRPLPTAAEVRTEGRIAEVTDKGKGALVELETVTYAAGDDSVPLFTNRWGGFLVGEGGFGGRKGSAPGDPVPERPPDQEIVLRTLPQQALLYRLSGDRNPLHADPERARAAGFERPIMHGLCTYGMACKAVVDSALGGDVTRVAGYRTRFAGPLLPGESLQVSLWKGPEEILLAARCPERDAPVLTHGAIALA